MMVNIEQIKQDRKNGVIISNLTWDALVAYASELEKKLTQSPPPNVCKKILHDMSEHCIKWADGAKDEPSEEDFCKESISFIIKSLHSAG